jgi:hypothetical protein
VVLVLLASGMRRSLRRIEREERGPVHGRFNFFADSSADSLWQNAADGGRILVSPGACSDCRGPFYHRFFTKEGCEGALAEWNASLNEQRMRQVKGPILDYRIVVAGECGARPPRQ